MKSSIFSVVLAFVSILAGFLYINIDEVCQKLVETTFQYYPYGVLCVEYPDKTLKKFGRQATQHSKCDASIIVRDKLFFKKLATAGGQIGLGEAYYLGLFDVPQPNPPRPLSIDESSELEKFQYHVFHNQFNTPITWIRSIVMNIVNIGQFRQWLLRKYGIGKTKKEDLEDIIFHYDVGNDFFESYLGPTLSGSCAIFNNETKTLEDAQNNKWSIVYKKIGVNKDHHVLDVGCGWGYLCSKINNETGAKCSGISLSEEQLRFARNTYKQQLCQSSNQKNCTEFLFKDYHDLTDFGYEIFDRIISVGMVEHVHYLRIQEYFNILYQALKPGGYMLIHGITMPDVHHEWRPTLRSTACQQANFINKYIFPGGCILHTDWMVEAAYKAGFWVFHQEHFGVHYAKTLHYWHHNLYNNWNKTKTNPKYDEGYYRLYEYYLAHCESAFATLRTDLTQFVFYKPVNKQNPFANYSTVLSWLDQVYNPSQMV